MAKVKVRYDATEEDAEVAVGDLPPIAFTKGIAEVDEDLAETLVRYSPHFSVEKKENKSNARSDSSVATTDGAGEGNDVGNGS